MLNCKKCIHWRVCRYGKSLSTLDALGYPSRLYCREYRKTICNKQTPTSEIRWPKPVPAHINDSWLHNGEISEASKRAIEEWELNERLRRIVKH